MDEKLLEIIDQFDLHVEHTYRGRGGTICVTKDGMTILKEFHSSAGKLMDEYELKQYLRLEGFSFVDQHIKNKQGTFFAEDRYHTIYIMKEYYEGKECDIRNAEDIKLEAKNLAQFHKIAEKAPVGQRERKRHQSLLSLLEKRTRELKRAKTYMEHSLKKGEFEYLYMRSYDNFFQQAKEAISICKEIGESQEKTALGICHGEYNQHNIVKTEKGIATINFEHFCYQSQWIDFHHFLRKALEKNQYQIEVAQKMIEGYNQIHSLEAKDYQFIHLLLLYPDKYFKIANHYNSRRKAFISPKDMEKLVDTIEQNKKKEEFLSWYQKKFL